MNRSWKISVRDQILTVFLSDRVSDGSKQSTNFVPLRYFFQPVSFKSEGA
jgi:hypothetical protein